MVIDAHTHCYPDDVSTNPRAWAESRGEPHWADLVAPKNRRSIQGWANPDAMIEAMDDAGVSQSILLGWYWERESTCRWHNEVISKWCEHAPDRFIGFAAIYPDCTVINQLERARSLGLRGVGELHPGVQNFDSSNDSWKALAAWCAERGWPVNFHTTRPAKDHPASVATPLEDYVRMAIQSPSLDIILAHWGGGPSSILRKTQVPNLYLDTSASPLLYDPSIFRQMIELVGIDQIIFGSDYPLRIYPRKKRGAEMKEFLHEVRCQGALSPSEQRAILGANIERLLAT